MRGAASQTREVQPFIQGPKQAAISFPNAMREFILHIALEGGDADGMFNNR